jgi:2,3-dihydro-2,3-dihydroxybenzoate dehydrogenase
VARRLVREPWTEHLVLADIRQDMAMRLAAELATDARRVDARHVDIADPRSIEALVSGTRETERVALVAGIFRAVPSLETEWSDFESILGVNLIGTFFAAQAYAREMVQRRSGAIVAVASIAARMPRMRQAAYCASKAGMRQALRVLAMETVPLGVRINIVSPGPTDTPMMRDLARDHPVDDLAQGSPESLRPKIPDGRVAQPEQVAAAVSYLLSPDADHVAFHDLYVDGGESLGM